MGTGRRGIGPMRLRTSERAHDRKARCRNGSGNASVPLGAALDMLQEQTAQAEAAE
jgi:hypothetical protein